jgi:hypothetical protein
MTLHDTRLTIITIPRSIINRHNTHSHYLSLLTYRYANTARYPDLILGAEIAVLMKQQAALVSTIDRLAGPQTMVLVTCDDFPAYPSRSKYERNLDRAFADRGFCKVILSAGRVRWRTQEVSERGRAPSVDYSSSSSCSGGSGGGTHYPPNGDIGGYSYPPGGGSEDKDAAVPLPPAIKSVKCAYLEHVPVQGMDGGDSSSSSGSGSGNGGEGMEEAQEKTFRKRGSSSNSNSRSSGTTLPLDALLRTGALRTYFGRHSFLPGFLPSVVPSFLPSFACL